MEGSLLCRTIERETRVLLTMQAVPLVRIAGARSDADRSKSYPALRLRAMLTK